MATKGYTLIEILVAIVVFVIIIAAPVSFFVSSIRGQQRSLAFQELLDNVSYNLEYMSRALRMALKDKTGLCITPNMNYEITRVGKGIKFLNYRGECQEFFWDINNNQLKEVKGVAAPLALTSDDLEIISFQIGPAEPIAGWGQSDDVQPRVTLFLEAKGAKSAKPEIQPKIQIQTTISQRNLDVY